MTSHPSFLFSCVIFIKCTVTATLVAKECAKGSEEGVQDSVCQALVVGTFIALLGSIFILSQPDRLLGGVLSGKYFYIM